MSVHRSRTLRQPGIRRSVIIEPTKRKKDYDSLQHGIKILHNPSTEPDVDIVFIPGLNAHPEESWKSAKTDFNWTKDPDGLVRDFPRARMLLYAYESAWQGPVKVDQFIGNLAMTLLTGLKSERKDCQRRPIVFIGHSMGGLVIAKAIIIADSRKDLFPMMFEAIVASIFFGTPFGGAPVAAIAAMYAHFAEQLQRAYSSRLLDLMKPENEELRELKHEFMRLSTKLSPKIELYCFFEQHPTDFSKLAGLPGTFGLANSLIPKKYSDFVNQNSATLPGIDFLGIPCNHRDLVKFDGPKDKRWNQCINEHIKRIIHGAQTAVKGRLNSTRRMDRALVRKVIEALDSAPIQKQRKELLKSTSLSSWILKEVEYIQWLGNCQNIDSDKGRFGDCIWIRGPAGRGKTSATMAALEGIEELIKSTEENHTGQEPILLAYFFCDTDGDYSTAEDVLKSLLTQLINQQEMLAQHAAIFSSRKRGKEGSHKSMTVENLWQSFQDMLSDEFIGSKIYIVLNNLHVLPEDSDSTIKFMDFINTDLQRMRDPNSRRVSVRWLVTSRKAYNIENAMRVRGVRLIDLEDSKYEGQVQLELRKHAKERVKALEEEKRYNKALTFFVSSLIGKRAQNTQWIDITCGHLGELPEAESDIGVRRVLEMMPQDLNTLLIQAWLRVFSSNEQDMERIKEMLRTLVLTYEDPTDVELDVLSGMGFAEPEHTELHQLIKKCKPLLDLKFDTETEPKVTFTNAIVKTHLLENSKQLLDMSEEEIEWQHGVIALRSFGHLKDKFDGDILEIKPEHEEGAPEYEDDTTIGISNSRHSSKHENSQDEQNEQIGDEYFNDDYEENGSEQSSEIDDSDSNIDSDSDGGSDSSDDSEISEDGELSDKEVDFEDDDENGSVDSYATSDESEADPEAPYLENRALPYTVKYWLRHASKTTMDFAELLSVENDFWEPDSRIRRRWLMEYNRMTNDLADADYASLKALHVVAAVGFRDLAKALIQNGYEDEIHAHDDYEATPLHIAAGFGHADIVEELLINGAEIDDGDVNEEGTPLGAAAECGHVEVMRKLMLRGANRNAICKYSGPVINAAIRSGNREAVELLVENKVSLTIERDDITPPLAEAATLSDASMYDYLVEKYAEMLPLLDFSKALVQAAEYDSIEIFKKLLSFKHKKKYFQKALDAAAKQWNWEIVMIILEACQNLDCDNAFYEAATAATEAENQDKVLKRLYEYSNGSISSQILNDSLYYATDMEEESTVRLLLQDFNVNPNATGEEYGNALTASAFDGTLNIIRLLLDAGADINSPDGWALQTAAAEGHYDMVQLLLQRGADVNALTTNKNFKSGTAIQGACEASRADIVELLLEHKANPNLGSGEDAPPIVAAAVRNEEDILKMLVGARVQLDVLGGRRKSTPLICSAKYMELSSLELLLDAGADINLPDSKNNTALIKAARRGDSEAVTFLLSKGANVLHTNKKGRNALQIAMIYKKRNCLKVLVEHVSTILRSLELAVNSNNVAVAMVLRNINTDSQGLNYNDPPPHQESLQPTAETTYKPSLPAAETPIKRKPVSSIVSNTTSTHQDRPWLPPKPEAYQQEQTAQFGENQYPQRSPTFQNGQRNLDPSTLQPMHQNIHPRLLSPGSQPPDLRQNMNQYHETVSSNHTVGPSNSGTTTYRAFDPRSIVRQPESGVPRETNQYQQQTRIQTSQMFQDHEKRYYQQGWNATRQEGYYGRPGDDPSQYSSSSRVDNENRNALPQHEIRPQRSALIGAEATPDRSHYLRSMFNRKQT